MAYFWSLETNFFYSFIISPTRANNCIRLFNHPSNTKRGL